MPVFLFQIYPHVYTKTLPFQECVDLDQKGVDIFRHSFFRLHACLWVVGHKVVAGALGSGGIDWHGSGLYGGFLE
jgi:hypothetical protein